MHSVLATLSLAAIFTRPVSCVKTKALDSRIAFKTTFRASVIYFGSAPMGVANSLWVLINKLPNIQRILFGFPLGLEYQQNGYRRRMVMDDLPFGQVDRICKLVEEGRP